VSTQDENRPHRGGERGKRRAPSRGTQRNPENRFERLSYERDEEFGEDDRPVPTRFYRDATKTVIARNQSPDIPFDASINPYRGCEHGCVYCYARPFHEYLGFSAGLDFETRILVKEDAPELLRAELASPRWVPRTIALSGVTDPYQPAERRLRITRGCLEVLTAFRNPVHVITKNELVTRDLDLLGELAAVHAATVMISIPTMDADLARILEPRTSVPERRFRAMEKLAAAGIPVGISLSPVIPALTDHEMPGLMTEAAARGAEYATCTPLRLPRAVAGLFVDWLERHFPDRKEKILHRIRAMRGGELNDARYGGRMRGEGEYARQILTMYRVACAKTGLREEGPSLSASAFLKPGNDQLTLF